MAHGHGGWYGTLLATCLDHESSVDFIDLLHRLSYTMPIFHHHHDGQPHISVRRIATEANKQRPLGWFKAKAKRLVCQPVHNGVCLIKLCEVIHQYSASSPVWPDPDSRNLILAHPLLAYSHATRQADEMGPYH